MNLLKVHFFEAPWELARSCDGRRLLVIPWTGINGVGCRSSRGTIVSINK